MADGISANGCACEGSSIRVPAMRMYELLYESAPVLGVRKRESMESSNERKEAY